MRACLVGVSSCSPRYAACMPREPRATRPCMSANPSHAGGHKSGHRREACWCPLQVQPRTSSHWSGSARTVCCHVGCGLPAVMLPVLRLLWPTLLRPCGGLHAEARCPWHRRVPRLRRRPRAVRPQLKRPPGGLQHRRELRPGVVGFRPRPRPLRAPDSPRGLRVLIGEANRSFLPPGGQLPCGAPARAPPPRAGWAPFCIRLWRGCAGDSTADGQQRGAWGLGQAGQGLPLTCVSAVPPHREAPSMVF